MNILAILILGLVSACFSQGMEWGLPELVQNHGVYNPALRAISKESSGHIGIGYGKRPYNTETGWAIGTFDETSQSGFAQAQFSASPGSFALSAAMSTGVTEQKSTGSIPTTYERMQTYLFATLGYAILPKWALGTGIEFTELDGIQLLDGNDLGLIPQHNYTALSIFLHGDLDIASLDLKVTPYDARSAEKATTLIAPVDTAWSGPIGIEAALSKTFPYQSKLITGGLRSLLEIPQNSDYDKTTVELSPFVRFPLSESLTTQAMFTVGTRNAATILGLHAGIDWISWKNLILAAGATYESSRFRFDNEASTTAGFQLGLGWRFQ